MVGGCLRFVDEIRIKDVELVACQAQVGKIAINGMLAPASRIYTYKPILLDQPGPNTLTMCSGPYAMYMTASYIHYMC